MSEGICSVCYHTEQIKDGVCKVCEQALRITELEQEVARLELFLPEGECLNVEIPDEIRKHKIG